MAVKAGTLTLILLSLVVSATVGREYTYSPLCEGRGNNCLYIKCGSKLPLSTCDPKNQKVNRQCDHLCKSRGCSGGGRCLEEPSGSRFCSCAH